MGISGLKKAESYLQSGKFDRAEKELRKLLRKNNKLPEVWLMLASVYGQVGRYSDVASAAKKAIAINPELAIAYSLLGSADVYLGKLNEAIKALETANRLTPGNASVLNNLGNTYYAVGKYDQAEQYYQQALNIDINFPQSNFGMANCCLAKSLWTDAVKYFKNAYNTMSDNYDINMSLGKAYTNLAYLDEAYECIDRATGLTESPSVAYFELAHIEQLRGELEKASSLIEKSLKYDNKNTNAISKRAEINYKLGYHEQAHKEIKLLVLDNSITPPVILTWGNLCNKFDECDQVIEQAETLLENSTISKSDQISLHYMLGSLYDKKNRYDEAFKHYHTANSALDNKFDHHKFSGMVGNLIDDFCVKSIDQMPTSECEDDKPVFIIGMPRSGTSLVEQILASHPNVYGAGELNDIKNLASTLFTDSQVQNVSAFTTVKRSTLTTLAKQYLGRLEEVCGYAERVTDKMPANFLWLGFIMQLFPNAKIIHCNRDPRDTCLSIYFQQFTMSHEYANNLEDIMFYYKQYLRLMDHWQNNLKLPVFNVDYNDLVNDVENVTREMINHLGLPWDDQCLLYHESERATATASWDQVRQPIYTKSLARWKGYKNHLTVLLEEFGTGDVASRMHTEKSTLNSDY